MTKLPDGWAPESLSDVCLTVTKADPVSTGREQVRYVDIGSVDGARHRLPEIPWIDTESAPSRCRQIIAGGDTVFSTVRPYLEKIAFIDGTLDGEFASTGFCVLRPGPQLLPRYLFHFSVSHQMLDQVLIHQRGVSYPAVLDKDVKAATIPLPPLDEQRRIVDILEDHLSRLDAAQADLARASSALSVMNLSVLNDIRRTLLDSSVPLEPLGDVCSTSLGKMLDAKKASGTPTPYLRNINVRWGGFDLSDVKTVPLSDAERTKFDVKPGDLLVCEGGEPGRCAVWVDGPTGITYQKALHRVRAKDPSRVAPDFVALLLEEFIRMGRADRMFTGTTIRHLPQEKLRVIELPVPELLTQRDTVERVTNHVQVTSRLASELERVAHEGVALRRSLLTAAFSGRLTGRTSDLDVAEELAAAEV